MAEERSPETAAEVARQAAITQAVSQLTYLAVMLGVSWAIMNRDMLWRAKETVRRRWKARHADPHATQVAEFRREIADIERGSDGSGIRAAHPGLYGPDAGRF